MSSTENDPKTAPDTFLLALGAKLCCHDKAGRMVGTCPQLFPYYNVLNGECYATREACKEAAGGYDFCYQCGKC
ncbi:MAG: hypothetical protein KGZ49_13305 [Syntrophaceae bacterium]|nr:hypothetical protein [Syntrophaceae bacterium]